MSNVNKTNTSGKNIEFILTDIPTNKEKIRWRAEDIKEEKEKCTTNVDFL
jgi:hypothetical protein